MGQVAKFIGFLLFILAFLILEGIIQLDISTDIQAHIEFVKNIQNGTNLPPNFLFYCSVLLCSFFSSSTSVLLQTAVVILSFSIFFKFYFSLKFIGHSNASSSKTLLEQDYIPALFIAMLCFSFAIPNPFSISFYLGQTPPNIWHNSTIIFLMPFAILLFWKSAQHIENPTKKSLIGIFILVFLNAIIKPSFLFVFIPAFAIISFVKNKISKILFFNLIPVFFAGILILLQFLLIFVMDDNSIYERAEKSSVFISPFEIWSYFSKNIPVSILISISFPIAISVAYFKKLKNKLEFQYSWLCYFIAITIFALVVESGPRKYHLNFSWQNIVCSYLLFLVTGKLWINQLIKRKKLLKVDLFILGLFFLHFLSGMAYIIRLFLRNTYY